MTKMYRQGEILLVQVDSVEGKESLPMKEIVLGHGETGNEHVITGENLQWLHDAMVDIDALKKDGALSTDRQLFVEVGEDAEIEHRSTDEGHRGFAIPAGLYAIHIDTETMWWEDEVRRVID